MLFHLLGNQMLGRNLEFFLVGVASQGNHIHAVCQRFWNRAVIIRCCDKHHIAQIERHVDIMVVKGGILLGIEHFQKSRGRVPSEIVAEFVDLIEQKQWIFGARLLDG